MPKENEKYEKRSQQTKRRCQITSITEKLVINS